VLDDEVEPEEADEDVDETTKDSVTKGKKKSFFLDFDTGEVQSIVK